VGAVGVAATAPPMVMMTVLLDDQRMADPVTLSTTRRRIKAIRATQCDVARVAVWRLPRRSSLTPQVLGCSVSNSQSTTELYTL